MRVSRGLRGVPPSVDGVGLVATGEPLSRERHLPTWNTVMFTSIHLRLAQELTTAKLHNNPSLGRETSVARFSENPKISGSSAREGAAGHGDGFLFASPWPDVGE